MGFMAHGLEDFQKSERRIHHRAIYCVGTGPYYIELKGTEAVINSCIVYLAIILVDLPSPAPQVLYSLNLWADGDDVVPWCWQNYYFAGLKRELTDIPICIQTLDHYRTERKRGPVPRYRHPGWVRSISPFPPFRPRTSSQGYRWHGQTLQVRLSDCICIFWTPCGQSHTIYRPLCAYTCFDKIFIGTYFGRCGPTSILSHQQHTARTKWHW